MSKEEKPWYVIPGEHVALARKAIGPERRYWYGRGLSQAEFAEKFGVDRRTIIRAEASFLNLHRARKIGPRTWIEVTGWNPEKTSCPDRDHCRICPKPRTRRK